MGMGKTSNESPVLVNFEAGKNFMMRFLDSDGEFEKTLLEEKSFYKNELKISCEGGCYIVAENAEANRASEVAWYMLHEKYLSLSKWKDAPVEFLGTFFVNDGSKAIAMFPVSVFLQA